MPLAVWELEDLALLLLDSVPSPPLLDSEPSLPLGLAQPTLPRLLAVSVQAPQDLEAPPLEVDSVLQVVLARPLLPQVCRPKY